MIIGAGLAGLIAAYVFPHEPVVEAQDRSWVEHQAVLRFRSTAVAELTGIPFRQVTVRKGIYSQNAWTTPNIAVCNAYAAKTIGCFVDRSIWDIDPVTRYIAPPDLRERMCDAIGGRISWNCLVPLHDVARYPKPVISTVPMNIMATELLAGETIEFRRAPILTTRVTLPGADVFQTVYFPDACTSLYRASITGDLLVCEWAGSDLTAPDRECGLAMLRSAFALSSGDLEGLTAPHKQHFGKIAPIDEALRRDIILQLTEEFGVYSLGRFATWRNLLLDDVVHDAAVIKRLLTSSDDYDRKLGRPVKL